VVVLGEAHLRRMLQSYARYYNDGTAAKRRFVPEAAVSNRRLLIDLIRRDIDLTMEFTDSVAPGPNDHGRRCRRKPGNLRAAKG
jgi:hypothetical protein